MTCDMTNTGMCEKYGASVIKTSAENLYYPRKKIFYKNYEKPLTPSLRRSI